jgi:predicted porin
MGVLFSHANDIDNTNDAIRVDNVVKYVSPNNRGFVVGAMYALGGVPGSVTRDSSFAGGVSYANNGLYLAGAYFLAHDPATQFPDAPFSGNAASQWTSGPFGYLGQPASDRLIGVGGTYTIGALQVAANYTNSRYADAHGTTNSVVFNNYEGWLQYYYTPRLKGGLGYTYTHGSVGYSGATPTYHQVNLGIDYALSKRTDVNFAAAFQQAGGGAHAAIYNGILGTSSTNRQLMTRVALRTKF